MCVAVSDERPSEQRIQRSRSACDRLMKQWFSRCRSEPNRTWHWTLTAPSIARIPMTNALARTRTNWTTKLFVCLKFYAGNNATCDAIQKQCAAQSITEIHRRIRQLKLSRHRNAAYKPRDAQTRRRMCPMPLKFFPFRAVPFRIVFDFTDWRRLRSRVLKTPWKKWTKTNDKSNGSRSRNKKCQCTLMAHLMIYEPNAKCQMLSCN